MIAVPPGVRAPPVSLPLSGEMPARRVVCTIPNEPVLDIFTNKRVKDKRGNLRVVGGQSDPISRRCTTHTGSKAYPNRDTRSQIGKAV